MRFIHKILIVTILATFVSAPLTKALSQEQLDIYNSGVNYFDAETSTTISSSCLAGGGTLPSVVPAPYNSIFTAAANKFSVPPAFLAALFYAGEHGSSWPTPPPPYGNGGPWKSSGVTSPGSPDWPTQPPGPGAAGPFQFEYPTWQSQQQDGNGDGQKDVEDLSDAAFSGANYLASLGANTTDTQKLHDAAYHYNGSGPQATAYADKVMAAYQQFNAPASSAATTTTTPSSTCAGGNISAYQNPLRDVSQLSGAPGIDAGVDYSGEGPVYALGDAVIDVANPNSGWVGGNVVAYTLSGGPAAGKTVYVAENCTVASSIRVGQKVNSNTVICNMHNSYPFIETGWAIPHTSTPLAYWPDGAKCYYFEQGPANPIQTKTSTAYGVNFDSLMSALGAPASVKISSDVTCTLPSDWPAW